MSRRPRASMTWSNASTPDALATGLIQSPVPHSGVRDILPPKLRLPLRDRLRCVPAFDYQLSQQFDHCVQRQNIGSATRRSPAIILHVKIGALVRKKLHHFGNLRSEEHTSE